jgi:hypothetical protein
VPTFADKLIPNKPVIFDEILLLIYILRGVSVESGARGSVVG